MMLKFAKSANLAGMAESRVQQAGGSQKMPHNVPAGTEHKAKERFHVGIVARVGDDLGSKLDLPARLLAAQVAKLLNCTPEDVAVLVTAGKLRPLGRPNPNAAKFFSTVELFALLADRGGLDEATKTIGHFWKRRNARWHGLPLDSLVDEWTT